MKKLLLILLAFISISIFTNAQNTVLWGTTPGGGAGGSGTIFSINDDGTNFQTHYNFFSPAGFEPVGNLTMAPNGNFYGDCAQGGDSGSCTVFVFNPVTNFEEDLYSFGVAAGDAPMSGLTRTPDGMLYGVGTSGGAYGTGVIYRFNPFTNVYTDVHDFDTTSGSFPFGSPVYYNGKLYGTTANFSMIFVSSGIAMDSIVILFDSLGLGYIYGPLASPVIYSFDITTSAYEVLHTLDAKADGLPQGDLLVASDGKMYGMTINGGTDSAGIIFSIDPATHIYTKLHDFIPATGINPMAGLTEHNGMLYGAASAGGLNQAGVLFSLTPNTHAYTDIYDFDYTHGATPSSDITWSNNKLYGSARTGGVYGLGVLFNYNLNSLKYTDLHDFDGTNDGGNPSCALSSVNSIAEGIAPPLNLPKALIYPTPMTTALNVDFNADGLSEIILYDENSSEVARQSFNHLARVNTSDFAAGNYLYELRNQNRMVEKGRLVKVND